MEPWRATGAVPEGVGDVDVLLIEPDIERQADESPARLCLGPASQMRVDLELEQLVYVARLTPYAAARWALRSSTTARMESQSTSRKLCIGQYLGPHMEQNSADLK